MLRICVILIAILTRPAYVLAATISLSPVADQSAEDRGDVTTGALRDGLYDIFLAADEQNLQLFFGNTGFEYEQRAALEFAIGNVVSQGTVTRATLLLRMVGRVTRPIELTINGYAGDGALAAEDFSANLEVARISFPESPSLTLEPIQIDATALLQQLQEVNATHAGFALSVDPTSTLSFGSMEFGHDSYSPRLVVEFVVVPEPSGMLLALVGAVLGFLILKRL